MIGFFTPELFHGIGSGGFHIHFANDDRNFGGHILDFEVDDVKVEIQNFETQYGTCVINEFKQSPSLRNNIKIQIAIKIFKEIEEYATKKFKI